MQQRIHLGSEAFLYFFLFLICSCHSNGLCMRAFIVIWDLAVESVSVCMCAFTVVFALLFALYVIRYVVIETFSLAVQFAFPVVAW